MKLEKLKWYYTISHIYIAYNKIFLILNLVLKPKVYLDKSRF